MNCYFHFILNIHYFKLIHILLIFEEDFVNLTITTIFVLKLFYSAYFIYRLMKFVEYYYLNLIYFNLRKVSTFSPGLKDSLFNFEIIFVMIIEIAAVHIIIFIYFLNLILIFQIFVIAVR